MNTKETPTAKASKAAAPLREPRDMCFSNRENFPYLRWNGFSTDWPVLPIVSPKQTGHMWSIRLHPKWFSTSQISLQIKTGWRLTLVWDSIQFWGGRWPRQSVLPPDKGMKIAAWHWRKSWLSIHNKIKSEQCFAVTSAERVAVFQASFKVVRRSSRCPTL